MTSLLRCQSGTRYRRMIHREGRFSQSKSLKVIQYQATVMLLVNDNTLSEAEEVNSAGVKPVLSMLRIAAARSRS